MSKPLLPIAMEPTAKFASGMGVEVQTLCQIDARPFCGRFVTARSKAILASTTSGREEWNLVKK